MEDRRIRLEGPRPWTHHRSGWKDAVQALHRLHHPGGVRFESFLDALSAPLQEPFVGVLHHTPRHPDHLHPWDLQSKYRRLPDLEQFFDNPLWKQSEPWCRGLITLSDHTTAFVRRRTTVPVHTILHPRREVARPFRWKGVPRRLLFVGSWLRDFRPFFHLRAPGFRKYFVVPFPWVKKEIERLGLIDPHIRFHVGMGGRRFDRWLRNSVVFLRLFDASAVNTLMDCLFFHTPLVVNRLPALEQYLGPGYPLFYETRGEAETLLGQESRLRAGHEYLRAFDKDRFTLSHFVEAIQGSPLYRSLPHPGAAS